MGQAQRKRQTAYDEQYYGSNRAREPRKERNINKKPASKPKKANQYDFPVMFVVILLVLFGIIMVFSSSYYYAMTHAKIQDMYFFLKKQAKWGVLGVLVMFFMANFNYRILKRFAFMGYAVSNVLLLIVMFVGDDINGSARWLEIGPISFQPSEISKIALILYLSHYLSKNRKALDTFGGFCKCLGIILIPAALIGVANASTAIIIVGIGGAILFVASPKMWYFFPFAALGACGGAALLAFPQFAYRLKRIQAWIDPFADPTGIGYQIIQSLYAVGSGGLFGLGLGQSRQKYYIPESYTDIIFAIICEEMGLVGAVLIITLFLILVWRGIKIALNAQDLFGSYMATGITSIIAIQAILNIAVVTNTIPNTGIPMPFVTYGGSSLIFTMASMGILLNISRYQRINE